MVAQHPYSLNWTGPLGGNLTNLMADSITLRDLPEGTYDLVLQDVNGCTQNCSFTISSPDCTAFGIQLTGINPSCFGEPSGTIDLSINNGQMPYSIQWSQSQFNDQESLTNLSAGSYQVVVIDANGCQAQDSVLLSDPALLELNCTPLSPASSSTSADGQANLMVAGGSAPYTLSWDGPLRDTQILDNGGSVMLNALLPGTYNLNLRDANGCESDCSVFISVASCALTVSLDLGQITCPGAADGFADLIPDGAIGPVTVDWNMDHLDGQLSVTNLAPGAYDIFLTDSLGCQVGTGFNLEDPLPMELVANTTSPTCPGDRDGSIILEAISGGTPPYRFSLDGGELNPISNFPFSLNNISQGSYSLLIEDVNGCQLQSQISISDPPPLILTLETDKTIGRGESTELKVSDLNFDPATIQWTPEIGLNPPDSIPTIASPVQTTVYKLTLTNADGCSVSDNILVQVNDQRQVYIPNAFRPDSGENNRFTVFAGSEVESINLLRIFDRWGDQVFESTDFAPNDFSAGWDGNTRGQAAPQAVYVYMAEVTFTDGEQAMYYGEVTLVR